MGAKSDPRSSREYAKDNHRLRDSLPPICTWCGQWIDYSLHFNSPMAWTSDHTKALADGGELYGDRTLMHRKCNSEKEAERRKSQPIPTYNHPDHRFVVLLCGPPGAGKTTAAHESGLVVYDRDDPHWTSEPQFSAALRSLGADPDAQAVVIRSAPSSESRRRIAAIIAANHMYLIDGPRAELARRIAKRGRSDARYTHAALNAWHRRFDNADDVPPFPGWSAMPYRAPSLKTTREW